MISVWIASNTILRTTGGQKKVINDLHREGNPKNIMLNKLVIHRELSPCLLTDWVEGKSVVGKWATGKTADLRGVANKVHSRSWRSITRRGLRLESEHQEFGSNLWIIGFVSNILSNLKRKRTRLLLKVFFSDESSLLEFGGRVERCGKIYRSLDWSVKRFGVPCHLLVLVHSVFWSSVNEDLNQEALEHFQLLC